jgi:hypothetical protein
MKFAINIMLLEATPHLYTFHFPTINNINMVPILICEVGSELINVGS